MAHDTITAEFRNHPTEGRRREGEKETQLIEHPSTHHNHHWQEYPKLCLKRNKTFSEDMFSFRQFSTHNFDIRTVQVSAIGWALSCVNPASRLALAAGGEFTQPRTHLLTDPSNMSLV